MDTETLVRWLDVGLVVVPIVLLVRRQCRAANLWPVLPIVGLSIGLFLELNR